MTTIAAFNSAAASAVASNFASQIASGVALQLAAGVMGQFFRPLNAGPMAFAQLPSQWNVAAGSVGQPPQAAWSASVGANGRGNIDLGDGYTLEMNENNSEVTIKNANTGETTRIWGDPHVEIDGKHAFDFWGTTTFTLGNGTKITIGTEQWGGNPNAYVASELTITKGNNALHVTGLSQNQTGDLAISMSQNGRALDAATRDGYTLHENKAGAGWNTEIGTRATQADLNHTAVGADYGPGSTAPSLAEMGPALGAFLSLGSFGGLLMLGAIASLADGGGETRGRAQAQVRARVDA